MVRNTSKVENCFLIDFMGSYSSFVVQLDDCTFLRGSSVIEKENNMNVAQIYYAFDRPKNQDIVTELITIKVLKNIDGCDYEFISPPYTVTIDYVRIRIEFFKSLIIYYNEGNPQQYYFEFSRI
jgi:hypothetical protein